MLKFNHYIQLLLKDESGLTAVEYAIAGSLVSLGVVAAFTQLGTGASSSIDCLSSAVGGATDNC